MTFKTGSTGCRTPLRILLMISLVSAFYVSAVAQTTPALSDESYVSVLTILPGDPLYSAFGHTAIRVRDDSLSIDAVYNFGTFDFDTDWFYLKFARGLLDYRLARNRFVDVLNAYTAEERPIIEQRLQFDLEERRALILRLERNYLPQNRYYRYEFFFDNCSTRPRDVIETTAQSRVASSDSTDGRSFRDLISPFLANRPWTNFGIDILLGAKTDQVASNHESLFLPTELMNSLALATKHGSPLVTRTDTLFWPREYSVGAKNVLPGPFPVNVLLLLAGIAAFLTPWPTRAGWRFFDAIVFGIAGLAGLVILLLWFATEHTVTGANWNILWALPTNLLLAVMFVLGRDDGMMKPLLWLAAATSAAFLAGWPVIPQSFHLAVAPLALLLLVRSAFRLRAPAVAVAAIALVILAARPGPANAQEDRQPIRSYGFYPGVLSPGTHNAITDVEGVLVGHFTLDQGDSVRTGVTAILPHNGNLFQDKVPAAIVVGNGFGKLAGSTQIDELGEIETPIILTNTLSVSTGVDAVIDYTLGLPGNESVRSVNAVVGETNDGYLNDIRARLLEPRHVLSAIRSATSGSVDQGSVGAGRGTVAFGWKGGIGTSSRRLPDPRGGYSVGVLVQSNYGGILRILGAEVGKELGKYYLKSAVESPDGSIMIVVATDAPLSDRNLGRLGARALAGLARTGSSMSNGSGDYVIAFSTAESVRRTSNRRGEVSSIEDVPNNHLSPLFQAVIEATEEAIYNSIFTATTVSGHRGTIEALPIEPVLELLGKSD